MLQTRKRHTPPWCGENPVSRMFVKAQCPSLQQCLCRKLIQMEKLTHRGHVAAQVGERQEENEQGLDLPGRGGIAPCGRHELHVCKEDCVPGWQPRIHGSRGWLSSYMRSCPQAVNGEKEASSHKMLEEMTKRHITSLHKKCQVGLVETL